MNKSAAIEDILRMQEHRPIPMPAGPWKYYQEWQSVIFGHWQVTAALLRPLIPSGLDLDLYSGSAWISLVAFSIKGLTLRPLPPFPPLSDFHEINMRTYVLRHGKPGIYFLSIEAQKWASTLMAKLITGLPYVKSDIRREGQSYRSFNRRQSNRLDIVYEPQPGIVEKSSLECWLAERYCLFHELGGGIYSHDIHHRPWPLQAIRIGRFKIAYRFGALSIDRPADLYHFSEGVQVPTWGKAKGVRDDLLWRTRRSATATNVELYGPIRPASKRGTTVWRRAPAGGVKSGASGSG